jgi:hypothetical protein
MNLIVILERQSVNPEVVSYVLRAAVPVSRQFYYADPEKASAYKQASADELTALRAGQYLEMVESINISGQAVPALKQLLIGRQTQFQAAVTADGLYNPCKYYGSAWTGSAWNMVQVD